MMYKVILAVAAYDGKSALTERSSHLVVFRDLFANVVWQMNSWEEDRVLFLHTVHCAKCRQNLKNEQIQV